MFSFFCLLKVLLSLKVTLYSKLEKKFQKLVNQLCFVFLKFLDFFQLSWAKFSSANLGSLVFQEIVLNSDNARVDFSRFEEINSKTNLLKRRQITLFNYQIVS